jgi:hypothetical protein
VNYTLSMRGVEHARNLTRVVEDAVDWHHTAVLDPTGKRLAFEQLHDQVG